MNALSLVLGAGGARGLPHIHALRAFDELGIKPAVIAGSSIGSILGASYCAGMTAEAIEAHVRDSFDDRVQLVTKAFQVRPESVKSFFADGGLRIGEFNLETILSVFLPDAIPETFEDLSIPLKVIATDYYSACTKVFASGPLMAPIAASSAIPAVFLPVQIDGRYYIDGGITDPCPMDCVRRQNNPMLAIDVTGGPSGDPDVRPGKVEAAYTANQILQLSIVKANARQNPDVVVLRPAVNSYRALDFLKVAEILDHTADFKDVVKRQIDILMNDDDN